MAKFDFTVLVKNNAGVALGNPIAVSNQPTESAAKAAVRSVIQTRSDAAQTNAADYADALSAFDS